MDDLLTAYEDFYRAVERLTYRLEDGQRGDEIAAALRELLVDFAPARIGVN